MAHRCQGCGETELRGRRWVCEACKAAIAQQRSTGPSVDYSNGGAELPGLGPVSDEPYRTPVQHDRERWLRQRAAEARREELGEESEITSWSELQQLQPQPGNFHNFGGPREPQDSVPLGRRGTAPITNPAAMGQLYRTGGEDFTAAARGEAVQRPQAPKPGGVQRKWGFIR